MDVSHYQSQTLVEVAYKALKSDITTYVLPPGKKIIVRELSERYGVSETPIKQALNRLVSEGLVESIPRRGMKVRVVEWEEIEELLDIRLMIETYCIKGAIKRLRERPALFDEFENLIKEHENVTQKISDLSAYYRNYDIDSRFHQLYVECAGKKRMAQLYANLGTHGYMYYVFGKQRTTQMLAGLGEHRELLAALRSLSETDAKHVIKLHIENAKIKLSKAFQANREEHPEK